VRSNNEVHEHDLGITNESHLDIKYLLKTTSESIPEPSSAKKTLFRYLPKEKVKTEEVEKPKPRKIIQCIYNKGVINQPK